MSRTFIFWSMGCVWMATRKETKWAIVAADQAWGRDSGASFRKAAAANDRTVVSENYPPFGTNDYAPYIQPYIQKVKDSGAEALWVALSGRDAVNFGTQTKQFGLLDLILVAGVSFVTDNTVRAMGELSKGIWGIINYISTLDTPENHRFVAAWAKHYPGSTPSNFEGETYVGMRVIFQTVQKAGSIKPADVAKALEGATFETVYGSNLMRKEDHQLVVPNFFGQVRMVDGVLKPAITMSVPAEQATPRPDGSCRLPA